MELKKEQKWYKWNGFINKTDSNVPYYILVKTTLMEAVVSYRTKENIMEGTALYENNKEFYIRTDNFKTFSKYSKSLTFIETDIPEGDNELLADVAHKV